MRFLSNYFDLLFNNKIATVIESGTDRQTDKQTDEGRHVKPPLSGRDLIMWCAELYPQLVKRSSE